MENLTENRRIKCIPKDFLVEVTNRCNHSCVFCAHHGMDCPQGEIDPELLKRILREAYDMGLRRVGLYTTGEMFMCKEIAIHVRNAKEIGYEYIYADTNGALATRENLTKVISAGLDSIKFSINAGTRETYAQIHGHDDFDKVIEHLKICHELKLQLNENLKIMVSFVVTNKTETEVDALREMISPYIDAFSPHSVRHFNQQLDVDYSYLRAQFPYNEITSTPIPCPTLFNRIHVTYDGYLTACCVDFNHDLLLADLKKVSLKEAWTGPGATKLREAHINNLLEGTMCYGCAKGKYEPYTPLTVE